MIGARLRSLPFRAAWRARTTWSARRGSPSIDGRLERPDRLQAYSRWVDVRGWALSHDGHPLTIRIFAGRQLLTEIRPHIARPELTNGHAKSAGFETIVPLDRAPARFWMRVVATDDRQPSASRVLGICLVRKTHAGSAVPARAAYGDVWNSVARTLSDARYSVAGTADAQQLADTGESTAADIARETDATPTDTVLEIGCGVGRVGLKLAPRVGRWIGADVSDKMIGYARTALAGLSNVSFMPLNGVDLAPLEPATIDIVYCTGVFMHLDEWDRFRYIVEAHRVLKPGGRLYIDNINLLSPDGWKLFSQLFQIDPLARPPNISKMSTPEELTTYANRAGFTDIRVRCGELWVTVVARKPAA